MKKNIVITFGVNTKNFSIWCNGSVQNIFFLFMLLEKIEEYNVHIVNFGKPISEINTDGIFDLKQLNFTEWDDIKNDVDVFIEVGITVNDNIIEHLKNNGTKIVLYRTGNAYVTDMEDILFNTTSKLLNIHKYDQIWISSHHNKINKYYFEEIYKSPVIVVPFIWDSFIIDMYNIQLEQNNLIFEYQNNKISKNVVIMEPNIDIIKTSIVPLLIVEKTYNKYPELINNIIVFNTSKIRNNDKFLSIIKSLNIYKKIQLEDRYNTPYILSKYTDIVLSHQWENELNYLYFDVMYGKYPLVHNSNQIKEGGYFYGDFNIESGSNVLYSALINENYNKKLHINNLLLNKFSVNNPNNIEDYNNKIQNLFIN